MKLGIFLLTENYHKTPHIAILNDVELAVYVESLGFDEVWFAEHHFNSFSVIPNPSLMMAYVAAKTSKISIGSAAFLAPFYQPLRLAEEISTLDNLSMGRINAGFAKGGFALDLKNFQASSEELRVRLFNNVREIDETLYEKEEFYPKPIQSKIPFYIATFSSKESIEFAARNNYGLMFSQGATIEECEEAVAYYKQLSGLEPEVVLMRVFYTSHNAVEAYENAVVATDHFVKSMRSLNAFKEQPSFNQANYTALLDQRYQFFDAKKFMSCAVVGSVDECRKEFLDIKRRINKLHLVLKPASVDARRIRKTLKLFHEEIQPYIK
ncbi:LLM class flavin-dependent oxidoreductase [Sulfurimonas microaerophilic]|uniref:LLM class flavin-dependent oxidoreductase n=1 Tax=Sulfurimonas microaerophilic TaxID=3058392 RepID=UPI0027150002|nr:LLM class flavin-dependent oxidoreductase [Sulfurimonas sp. hsl 1-7]